MFLTLQNVANLRKRVGKCKIQVLKKQHKLTLKFGPTTYLVSLNYPNIKTCFSHMYAFCCSRHFYVLFLPCCSSQKINVIIILVRFFATLSVNLAVIKGDILSPALAIF